MSFFAQSVKQLRNERAAKRDRERERGSVGEREMQNNIGNGMLTCKTAHSSADALRSSSRILCHACHALFT